MYPAVDASGPAAVNGTTAAITTASFNPPACVLVALSTSDPSSTATITNNGAALTWSPIVFRNASDGTYDVMAGGWYAVLGSSRTGMTVTATSNIANNHGLRVYVVVGADAADPVGASAEGSSAVNGFNTTAFTTEGASSLGFVAATDFTAVAGGPTSSDTTFTTIANGTSFTSVVGYKQLGPAGTSATFNIDSAGSGATETNWVSFEIKGTPPISTVGVTTPTPAGTTTTATTTAITPTLPAGTASGDRVFVIQAASNTSAASPANWTALTKDEQIGPTGTAPGAAVGRRFLSVHYRDYDGVWTMPSFALTSAAQNSHAMSVIALRKLAGDIWDPPTWSGVGHDTTAGTAYSATTPSFTTITDAMLLTCSGTNDNVTASGQTLTQSGATLVNTTERSDTGTATGNDVSIKTGTANVNVGATAAIVRAATLSAASEGGTGVVQQTTGSGSTPIADTDSATLTDVGDLAAADAATDSATLTDAAAVEQGLDTTGTDSATLTDVGDLAATLPLTDAGTLTDTESLALDDPDSATLTDAADPTATLPLTDVGLLVEVEALGLDDTDTAAAVDTGDLTYLPADTDSATLTETGDLATGEFLADTDSAAFGDVGSVTVTQVDVSGVESGSLTDAAEGSAALDGTEFGATTDTAGVVAALDLVESGAVTDTVTPSADLAQDETAALTDQGTLDAAQALTEPISVADAGDVSAPVTDTDTITLTDTGSVDSVVLTDADTVTLGETTFLDAGGVLSTADTGTLTEGEALGVVGAAADTGTVTDTAEATIERTDTDPFTVVDTAAVGAATVDDTDQVTLADDAAVSTTPTQADSAAVTDTAELTVIADGGETATLADDAATLAVLLDLAETPTLAGLAALLAEFADDDAATLADTGSSFDVSSAVKLPLRVGGTVTTDPMVGAGAAVGDDTIRAGEITTDGGGAGEVTTEGMRAGQPVIETLFGPRRNT